MKTEMVVILSCFCVTAIFADKTNISKWSFHRNLVKENLDTSRWRKFYSDDTWRIRCIFTDMDGDGEDELVAATTAEEEDRLGWVWNIYKNTKGYGFKQQLHRCNVGDIRFLCHWHSFYKMTLRNGNHFVIGLKMETSYIDKERRRIVKASPDCVFSLTNDGKFVLHEITPDLDSCFWYENVVSIERLYPEWYFGYDFKPPPDVPHSVYTQRMPYTLPKGDLRYGGGVGCPKDFAAFAAEYRREVKARTGKKDGVTVYAVFLDADNDGDGDCYISSDVEATVDGEYLWSLFICGERRFARAKDAVFPVGERKELSKLPVTVNAGKMSFCRVIRYDANPTFVVVNRGNRANLSIRKLITDYQAHRIEKLSCVKYNEEH